MYNYLYIAIVIIIIIFIFSFLINFAWIPLSLFLLYWIYKNIKARLNGSSSQQDSYSKHDYYKQDDYDESSYTNQTSSRSSSVIDADYKVVDEEETKKY